MTTFYRYPLSLRRAKIFGWLFTGLSSLSFVIVMLSLPNSLEVDPVKGLAKLFSTVIGVAAGVYFVHSYCDVGIRENEILVEFFWFYLHVPRNDVVDIKLLPGPFFKVWLIRTTRLTVFHRFYSLISNGSTYPGFVISSKIIGCDELIGKIDNLRTTH